MATYYNLTSFIGLQVGDEIIYNQVTEINLTGLNKIHIALQGRSESGDLYPHNTGLTYNVKGGRTECDFDLSLTTERYFTVFPDNGTIFSVLHNGTSKIENKNFALLIAGDAGGGAYRSSDGKVMGPPGEGGGLTAGSGGSSSEYGLGGSQSANGAGGTTTSGKNGETSTSWYYTARGASSPNRYGGSSGDGGRGWYNGGGGAATSSNELYGGGGGSGFVVGKTTTVYPTSYRLADATTLLPEMISCISNYSVTKGGAILDPNESAATRNDPRVIITVLEVSTSDQAYITYYDGNSFVPVIVYYYDGTEFVAVRPYYYDGNDFISTTIT